MCEHVKFDSPIINICLEYDKGWILILFGDLQLNKRRIKKLNDSLTSLLMVIFACFCLPIWWKEQTRDIHLSSKQRYVQILSSCLLLSLLIDVTIWLLRRYNNIVLMQWHLTVATYPRVMASKKTVLRKQFSENSAHSI